MNTSAFSVFGLEPFPTIGEGDCLTDAITSVLAEQDHQLLDGDVVVASKVVSISEKRHVELATITPSEQALALAAATGKPAEIVQLILDESTEHFLATPSGPIIPRHTLGYRLTSAGIDRDGTTGAWLLPANPDASARHLRDQLTTATGAELAVVIADSDGRADRRGATVISLGAAGIAPYGSPSTPSRPERSPGRRKPSPTSPPPQRESSSANAAAAPPSPSCAALALPTAVFLLRRLPVEATAGTATADPVADCVQLLTDSGRLNDRRWPRQRDVVMDAAFRAGRRGGRRGTVTSTRGTYSSPVSNRPESGSGVAP